MVGDGEQSMDTYIDFMCPVCNQFEQAYGEAIQGLVDDGTITLEHPPDRDPRPRSRRAPSTRPAPRTRCTASPRPTATAAVPFMQAMFANQPQEGTPGLTDDQILAIAAAAGVDRDRRCVNDGEYSEYVTAMTEKTPVAPGATGIGTPTIAINGEVIANSTLPAPADLATLFQ